MDVEIAIESKTERFDEYNAYYILCDVAANAQCVWTNKCFRITCIYKWLVLIGPNNVLLECLTHVVLWWSIVTILRDFFILDFHRCACVCVFVYWQFVIWDIFDAHMWRHIRKFNICPQMEFYWNRKLFSVPHVFPNFIVLQFIR